MFPFAVKSILASVVIAIFEVPSINVPVKNDAETKFPPSTLPADKLPVMSAAPAVVRLPPDTLPVAATTPTVVIFPPMTLPVTSTTPADVKFPPATLPVASTTPAVVMFPPATLPVASTTPVVVRLPPDTLPVASTTPDGTTLIAVRFPDISIAVSVIFAVSPPSTFNSMLPSAAGIRTLDVPF